MSRMKGGDGIKKLENTGLNQAVFGCLTNNSPGNYTRELFKLSKDLASLQVCNGKKFLFLGLDFL